MNITFRQLRAFTCVADRGSFARAAEHLHVSPSGLSVLVQELEAQLGLRLFYRSTRVVRLTDAGSEFLPAARKTLGDIEAATASLQSLADIKRGRVTVAASIVAAATMLPWVLEAFAEKNPGIQCIIKDGFEEDICNLVRKGEVDLGVGTLTGNEAGINATTLLQDHIVALFGDEHPLMKRGAVTWRELARYPLICLSPQSPSRILADNAFRAAGVTVTPRYEASFSSTIIGLVAAGLGVAALPVNVRQVSRRVKVHARLLVAPTVKRELSVIARSDADLSPAAAAFRQHLLDYARAGRRMPAGLGVNS